MKELCFATNNIHKIEEVRQIVKPDFLILSLRDIGCFDELSETGQTLEANSLQKAGYIVHKYNIPCFADDSGLEVEALNGEPGVFSARYAGEQKNDQDNISLLLKKLNGIHNRKARFRTVITLADKKGFKNFEGVISGAILNEPRGRGGFGYDPVFLPEGYHLTFAEMSAEEKNAISHRALAMQKLSQFLRENPLGPY